MKHKDRNIVELSGIIGDDFRYDNTQEGQPYASFSLIVDSYLKDIADATEKNHRMQFIRIVCFDKSQIEYLQKVDAKRGLRAIVFGRLTSYKKELKGNTFIQLAVTVRDIIIAKTK